MALFGDNVADDLSHRNHVGGGGPPRCAIRVFYIDTEQAGAIDLVFFQAGECRALADSSATV